MPQLVAMIIFFLLKNCSNKKIAAFNRKMTNGALLFEDEHKQVVRIKRNSGDTRTTFICRKILCRNISKVL